MTLTLRRNYQLFPVAFSSKFLEKYSFPYFLWANAANEKSLSMSFHQMFVFGNGLLYSTDIEQWLTQAVFSNL